MVDFHHKIKNLLGAATTFLYWRPESQRTLVLELEQWAAKRPDDPYLWFEGRSWTIGEFNAAVNRHAAAWRSLGVRAGDVVAVIVGNRPQFFFHTFALGKLGAIASLVNPTLSAAPLVHVIESCQPVALVGGPRQLTAVARVLPEIRLDRQRIFVDRQDALPFDEDQHPWPEWAEQLAGRSADNPPQTHERRLKEVLAYIYTSGTTGFPKPAIVKHHRFWRVGRYMAGASRVAPSDCIYICLPLYHGSALMVATSTTIVARSRLALARRFSASGFWRECAESGATMFVYIGELCRYLFRTPPSPWDRAHRVRRIFGNGLRGDIWEPFCERFGIDSVVEFYGSTEGNAETINLLDTVGSCGVLLPGRMALVRYDQENERFVRNKRGFLERVGPDEPGVLIGAIGKVNEYAGYTDSKATSATILRDVFKKGDEWFHTGDLLKRDRLRRLYFVDRLGDTFRWKSENVSTNEVAEVLAAAPSVAECNVYGVRVPGNEGRAGMGAIVAAGELDLDGIFRHLSRALPSYAQPRFLRVVASLEVTKTFKQRKVRLRDEGFDPARISDPLYLHDPRSKAYVPLTPERHAAVLDGSWPI